MNDHLTPGSLWTIAPSKRNTDQSFVGNVYEVIATNGPTAWLRRRYPTRLGGANPISVCHGEYAWHAAEHILEDLLRHEAEAVAEVGDRLDKVRREAVKRGAATTVAE